MRATLALNGLISVSEEFLDDFSFSFIVALMRNLFISLEISLSFVMIASFSTGVILLEFDPLFLKEGFTGLQKYLLSQLRYYYFQVRYVTYDILIKKCVSQN